MSYAIQIALLSASFYIFLIKIICLGGSALAVAAFHPRCRPVCPRARAVGGRPQRSAPRPLGPGAASASDFWLSRAPACRRPARRRSAASSPRRPRRGMTRRPLERGTRTGAAGSSRWRLRPPMPIPWPSMPSSPGRPGHGQRLSRLWISAAEAATPRGASGHAADDSPSRARDPAAEGWRRCCRGRPSGRPAAGGLPVRLRRSRARCHRESPAHQAGGAAAGAVVADRKRHEEPAEAEERQRRDAENQARPARREWNRSA